MTTASTSSGAVSQTACDRMPAARPAHSAAAPIATGVAARIVRTWAPTAAASPAMSLSGRAAVIQ